MTKRKIDWRWIWIVLGVITLLIGYGFGQCQACAEQWYSRGFFQLVRYVIDYSIALSPVALVYFLFIGLVFFILRSIRKYRRSAFTWKVLAKESALSIGAIAGFLLFLFQFLWGFNYSRIPLEAQWPLEVKPLLEEELKAEMAFFTRKIVDLRLGRYSAYTEELPPSLLPGQLESLLRKNLKMVLQNKGYPTPGRPRGRVLKPNGTLLRFGSAGVYIPFTGECHIDGGLHPITVPYVLSHELAHGYGISDEGSCNFLAFLTCIGSNNLFIQYAGYLAYWRYLRSELRRRNPSAFKELMTKVPLEIKADLAAINTALDKYPEWIPQIRYHTYDTYLKAQGITEGILNYNRVVLLVTAWRKLHTPSLGE